MMIFFIKYVKYFIFITITVNPSHRGIFLYVVHDRESILHCTYTALLQSHNSTAGVGGTANPVSSCTRILSWARTWAGVNEATVNIGC